MVGTESGSVAWVQIKPWAGTGGSPGTWYVSNRQLIRFGLTLSSQVLISFGVTRVSVTLKLIPDEIPANEGELLLSEDLLLKLHLPYLESLGVISHGNHLVLGPLTGIFIASREISKFAGGGNNYTVYRWFWQVSRELQGLACFFSLEDILWEQQLVKSWIIQPKEKNEGWTSVVLPLPRVIYDRCFGPHGQEDGRILRSRLVNIPEVVIFNAIPKLKKWESYQVLVQNPKLLAHLPETVLYSTSRDLTKALERCGQVYIKPDGLSKGQGVYKIAKGNKGLVVKQRTANGNKVYYFSSPKELNSLLAPYAQKGGGYLIQQQIRLARYAGNPFDLRVLCQKNIEGQWVVGGIVARIAARGSIITSPRSGGTVAPWPTVLGRIFNQQEDTPQGISSRLTEVAMEVCRTIEEQYGCCGELGLDMAVDSDGRIWLIEVNGKPLKVSLKRLRDSELSKKIYANPIKFAWYLASKLMAGGTEENDKITGGSR